MPFFHFFLLLIDDFQAKYVIENTNWFVNQKYRLSFAEYRIFSNWKSNYYYKILNTDYSQYLLCYTYENEKEKRKNSKANCRHAVSHWYKLFVETSFRYCQPIYLIPFMHSACSCSYFFSVLNISQHLSLIKKKKKNFFSSFFCIAKWMRLNYIYNLM